ncbi:MAG TPA: (2Fe-2S)-binding protein [bacterium]|nr:(2Fe-2S)-binding protein [bacterium]
MPKTPEENPKNRVSRRWFMKGFGTSVAAASLSGGLAVMGESTALAAESSPALGPDAVPLTLTVNGKTYSVTAEPRETLLEVLRHRLDITGPKLICDRGACGGCTVYLDGRTVYACMTLAVEAQGREIVTIEGLAPAGALHPVQQAFMEEDAMQCGFCTPGFVMSMAAVLDADPSAGLDEVREGIAGHVCRCGTYAQIFKAAENARRKMGG